MGRGYGFTNGTVELAWALILGLIKRLPQEDAAIRTGGWGAGLPFGLTGKTLGVLGLGTLGSGVARVGQALDMEVIAWSKNLTDERCRDVGVRKVDKETLFREIGCPVDPRDLGGAHPWAGFGYRSSVDEIVVLPDQHIARSNC